MFNVMFVSSVDSKLSKSEILRGLISEKLTTAAQEIFAVVERTVTGYEEEASGLRQQVERQRRQLEAVLQPQVTVCHVDEHGLLPVCEEEEAGVGEHTAETYGLEADDEEAEHKQESAQSTRLYQEQNYQTPPRRPDNRKWSVRRSFLPSSANSAADSEEETNDEGGDDGEDDWRPDEGDKAKKKTKTKLHMETKPKRQRSLRLSVCLLDDCQIDVLSKKVLKRCPAQELLCPPGLQEPDFLKLLSSIFPQLAADKPFDVFTTYKTGRLQPLKVETLTPEEICRTFRSNRAGKSALYIRLKTGEEHMASGHFDLSYGTDDAATDSPSTSVSILTSDETRQHMSSTVQHKDENRADDISSSSVSQQEIKETEEADDNEDAQISNTSVDIQAPSSADCAEGDMKLCTTDEKVQEKEVTSLTTTGKQGRKGIKSSPKMLPDNSDAVVSCKVCGVLYKSKNVVIKHAWSHVDDPGWLCGVCGEHSESAEELRSHLQSHLKTHICNICGKSFIRINAFMEHTAGHTGQKPHKCDICNKAFLLRSKLTDHQRTHLLGKYRCYVCQKSFSCQVELKLHSSVHAEKLYQCSVCEKSLCGLRSLSQHMLIHSGEKPYGCDVCGKHFRLLSMLKVHEKIHTVREKPYLCDVCCKTFPTQSQLKIHLKSHSEERLHTCSKCGKAFTSKFNLLVHMKVHSEERPYSCPQCGRSFKHKNNLNNHTILHSGEKKFVCGICGKACFRQEHLKVHMRTHNGEKPYKCTHCDKAFTQSHTLKTHMKSHQGEEKSAEDGLKS